MRLIDADHLLFLLNSAIELRKKLHRNTSDLDMMVDAVNNEPTAYDLDKVVEQLKELTEEECTLHECGIRSERCKPCIAKKAIEIVKGGSIKIIKNESED